MQGGWGQPCAPGGPSAAAWRRGRARRRDTPLAPAPLPLVWMHAAPHRHMLDTAPLPRIPAPLCRRPHHPPCRPSPTAGLLLGPRLRAAQLPGRLPDGVEGGRARRAARPRHLQRCASLGRGTLWEQEGSLAGGPAGRGRGRQAAAGGRGRAAGAPGLRRSAARGPTCAPLAVLTRAARALASRLVFSLVLLLPLPLQAPSPHCPSLWVPSPPSSLATWACEQHPAALFLLFCL